MRSGTQRTRRWAAALLMVALAGASLMLARASNPAGPVRQFETVVLIPCIALLIIVMAGYLIRGRASGQPLTLTRLKWKYRLLAATTIAGAAITWSLSLTRPRELLIAAYLPAVVANLIFNLFERRPPPPPAA